jgi:hypothetical protein
VHAVLHVAEDPGAFLYESTLFFSWNTLSKVLVQVYAHRERQDLAALAAPISYRNALLSFDCDSEKTVFQMLLEIQNKITAQLMLATELDRVSLATLWLLLQESALRQEKLTYRDQRSAYIRLAKQERPLLANLIQMTEAELPHVFGSRSAEASNSSRWQELQESFAPLYLLYSIWFLSGNEVYGIDDGHALFDLLEQNNVPLLPMQQTVLQSALHIDINSDAVWQGDSLFPLDKGRS